MVDVQAAMVGSPDLDNGILLGEINARGRSANSVTQQFTDYITSVDDQKYITFGMAQGEILNATLVNPANDSLNYDLVLSSVAEDGSLTVLKTSTLGTYVDSETGKTVDEGISYIHTGTEVGTYAIFVLSSSGSSTTESFTLTVSFDTADSYDVNEPNDSPFETTAFSGNTVSASLHVVNDQDWYTIKVDQTGIYSAEVSSYATEIYYAVTGNRLVRAPKFGNYNYELESGVTYYAKVYSDETLDTFTFANYTLELKYLTRYATMETAYNYGAWEDAGTMLPDTVPMGQQTAYYRFTIDSTDRAYASIMINESDAVFLGIYNSNKELVEYGSINVPDIQDAGIITKKSGGTYLVADMDGTRIGSFGYVRVSKVDRSDMYMRPYLNNRIHPGSGTFSFSGTARSAGGGLSSALTLNLTNESSIPPYAYVTDIRTKGTISPSVMGVEHYLNPGGGGWIPATSGSVENGNFRDLDTTYGIIAARQSWQFAYFQTPLQSTTMSRVTMTMEWEYDMNETSYETYQ